MNQKHLTALLRSKNPGVLALGFAILLTFFVPDVARVMDNPSLSLWGRVSELAIALGKTLGAVGLAAIPPGSLEDDEEAA